jgi:hypothetical protein
MGIRQDRVRHPNFGFASLFRTSVVAIRIPLEGERDSYLTGDTLRCGSDQDPV